MGAQELVIIAVIAIVLIFGVNKLPQIARNMGKAQGEFKKGLKEGDVEAKGGAPTPQAPPPAAEPAPEASPNDTPGNDAAQGEAPSS